MKVVLEDMRILISRCLLAEDPPCHIAIKAAEVELKSSKIMIHILWRDMDSDVFAVARDARLLVL